jgi:hypothetical protein
VRGYGNTDVLNWASTIDEQLIVAYHNQEKGVVNFVWYNLTNQNTTLDEPQWFTGGVSLADPKINLDIFG